MSIDLNGAVRTPESENAILLAVGPGGHLSEGTVAFVVTTASQLGLGIELVHVVPTLVGGPTGAWDVGISIEALTHEGQTGLDAAVQQVRDRAPAEVPVTSELVHGGVIVTLVERSAGAQLIVLEHREITRRERWGTGSVTAGVAARAHCPVVSVPASWLPAEGVRPITVAVEDAKRAPAEIWTALGLASVSDEPVVVLRATYLSPALEELLLHEPDHDEMLRGARLELARDADLPVEVRERVPCEFAVKWGKPVDVIVAASERSSLLVLARRDPHLPFGSHLGPVVREVLRESHCPVLVVEPGSSAA